MGLIFELVPGPLPPALRAGFARKAFQEEGLRASTQMADVVTEALTNASPVGVTGNLREAWVRGRRTILKAREIVQEVAARGAHGVKANVWDSGARPHFPPQRPIGFWIRRKLARVSDLFVTGKGGQTIPVSPPLSEATVRRIGYAIRNQIKQRRLPNPDHPEGHKKGLFTAAVEAVEPRLLRIHDQMLAKVVTRLSA